MYENFSDQDTNYLEIKSQQKFLNIQNFLKKAKLIVKM